MSFSLQRYEKASRIQNISAFIWQSRRKTQNLRLNSFRRKTALKSSVSKGKTSKGDYREQINEPITIFGYKAERSYGGSYTFIMQLPKRMQQAFVIVTI